jgi:hypothetical protein
MHSISTPFLILARSFIICLRMVKFSILAMLNWWATMNQSWKVQLSYMMRLTDASRIRLPAFSKMLKRINITWSFHLWYWESAKASLALQAL